MKEVPTEKYTGFGSCRRLEEFERDLKMKKILRRNQIAQEIEVILKPKEFVDYMMALRSQLNNCSSNCTD